MTISWTEPLNNGSNIDDYKVLWCFGSDSSCTFSTVVTSTGGATSQTVSGLSKGNYYQFKVQAHNSIGFSEASVAHLTIAADVPLEPDTPERVHALTDQTQITVSWQPHAESGGSPILHYILYWKKQ